MNHCIVDGHIGQPINRFLHTIKRSQSLVKSTDSTIRIDGETENGFGSGAGENAVGARAGVGGYKIEDEAEGVEAMGDGEGADHPLEGGVVVAEGVERGGVVEDLEVKSGELGVVMEAGFKEG